MDNLFYVSVSFSVDKHAFQSYKDHYNAPGTSWSRAAAKQYTYKSPVVLKDGDLVVVDTPAHGMTVARVHSCRPSSPSWSPAAYKWIAGIVDNSSLRAAWELERIAEQERQAEIARKAEVRANIRRLENDLASRQCLARLRLEEKMLHEIDPTIPELQRQLEAAKALL